VNRALRVHVRGIGYDAKSNPRSAAVPVVEAGFCPKKLTSGS
jgi:hypothetical protein